MRIIRGRVKKFLQLLCCKGVTQHGKGWNPTYKDASLNVALHSSRAPSSSSVDGSSLNDTLDCPPLTRG